MKPAGRRFGFISTDPHDLEELRGAEAVDDDRSISDSYYSEPQLEGTEPPVHPNTRANAANYSYYYRVPMDQQSVRLNKSQSEPNRPMQYPINQHTINNNVSRSDAPSPMYYQSNPTDRLFTNRVLEDNSNSNNNVQPVASNRGMMEPIIDMPSNSQYDDDYDVHQTLNQLYMDPALHHQVAQQIQHEQQQQQQPNVRVIAGSNNNNNNKNDNNNSSRTIEFSEVERSEMQRFQNTIRDIQKTSIPLGLSNKPQTQQPVRLAQAPQHPLTLAPRVSQPIVSRPTNSSSSMDPTIVQPIAQPTVQQHNNNGTMVFMHPNQYMCKHHYVMSAYTDNGERWQRCSFLYFTPDRLSHQQVPKQHQPIILSECTYAILQVDLSWFTIPPVEGSSTMDSHYNYPVGSQRFTVQCFIDYSQRTRNNSRVYKCRIVNPIANGSTTHECHVHDQRHAMVHNNVYFCAHLFSNTEDNLAHVPNEQLEQIFYLMLSVGYVPPAHSSNDTNHNGNILDLLTPAMMNDSLHTRELPRYRLYWTADIVASLMHL